MRTLRSTTVVVCIAALLALMGCGGGITQTTSSQPIQRPPSQAPRVLNVSAAPSVTNNPDCGAGWLATLNELAQAKDADAIQILSWNDYERNTQIESGVDNCVTISGSVSGQTLNWAVTGNSAAVDHYTVYSSTDGVNLKQAGTVISGPLTLDLSTLQLAPATSYTMFVHAVGRPSFQNKISAPIVYLSPAGTPPTVTLTVSPLTGQAPLTVTATMTSAAATGKTISTNQISFGDGSPAVNGTNATHAYTTAGSYTVQASATDSAGLVKTATSSVTVTAAPPGNQPPVARLTVTPSSGVAPLAVSASAAASSDPDGTIASYKLDFGDGTVVNAASGNHTYSAAGTYTVIATVTDNGGLSSASTNAVTVSTAPPPNQPPLARLNVVPSSGAVPLSVVASASASSDPDGSIASIKLDFGDSTVVTAASASHTYNTPGTYTVTATVTDNRGSSSNTTFSVTATALPPPPPGATYTAYGMTFPQSHPRLWWNPTRIATAKAWLASHAFTPSSTDYVNVAWKHVVAGTDCSSAVTWAATYAPPAAQVTPTAVGSDELRWFGENAILVYDWCNDQFSAAQKASFVSNWSTWLSNADQQPYVSASKPHSNYSIGYMRNNIEFGIAAYGDVAGADPILASGLNTRWAAWSASSKWSGGVPNEGSNYSAEMPDVMIPFQTTALWGRDALDDVSFYREMVYWMVYATTPSPTFSSANGLTLYQLFPFSDDERFEEGGILKTSTAYSNFGQWASDYWLSTGNVGKYARKWLDVTQADTNIPRPTRMFASLNTNTAPIASYSGLPIDLYAKATQIAYLRKAWDNSSTVVNLQMGWYPASADHAHWDWGNFQVWRGGRWLCRETTGYSNTVTGTPGINSNSNQSSVSQFSHNVLAFTNVALGLDSNAGYSVPTARKGAPTVLRLESTPGYFYADVDMTDSYLWDIDHSNFNTGVVGHVEREFIWVRDMETLVVLDRATTQNQTHGGTMSAGQVVTSFLTHSETTPTVEDSNHFIYTNGTQVLRHTVLVPANATSRVINEKTCSGCTSAVGQFRIEVDASGAAQRYQLHVLQARDSSGSNIVASVVDSNPADPSAGTLTVTLHPASGQNTVIVLNKGAKSVGGSVNGVALTNVVQSIVYTDNGPVWQ